VGLPALLGRQLTAGVCKFFIFERIARAAFAFLEEDYAKDRELDHVHPLPSFLFLSSILFTLL
jgi:hypothetical protein